MDAIQNGVRGCARCGQDHKEPLNFRPYARPVEDSDGTLWTHWALCPTNGDPIQLKVTPDG